MICYAISFFGLPVKATQTIFSGGYGEDETPVPIPNTEVKSLSGDGTDYKRSGE